MKMIKNITKAKFIKYWNNKNYLCTVVFSNSLLTIWQVESYEPHLDEEKLIVTEWIIHYGFYFDWFDKTYIKLKEQAKEQTL